MRRMLAAATISALLAGAGAAAAQSADIDPAAMMAQMQAAQANAQIASMHPGDDDLTCEQLQAELAATMNDPAVKAQIGETGAWAQQQQDRAHHAQADMAAMVAPSILTGIIGSFVPGAGYAQQAIVAAQNRQLQAGAAENMQQSSQLMGGMAQIMPQIYRGQRVMQLGQAKQCAFTQDPPAQPQADQPQH
jgi:hypothetical protein